MVGGVFSFDVVDELTRQRNPTVWKGGLSGMDVDIWWWRGGFVALFAFFSLWVSATRWDLL